jgi:glycosyltransferase involved in cell wall biosynthesis
MKDKINVYLQYPWKFPDSPYYKYLTENPSEGVRFVNAQNQRGVITNKKKFKFSNDLKKLIRKAAKYVAPSMPNAHLTKNTADADLIHCAHCLSKNKDFPWVADIEYTGQLWVMGTRLGKKDKGKVKEILMRENCRKIITWTELMKKEIISEFPDIKNKVEVIYPGVPEFKGVRRRHKDIILTFVGRYFYHKGGYHALEAINKLSKKYPNVKGIIVSETPEEVRGAYKYNDKIKFYGLMPQKELIEKIYSITDIFVYPGYSDSFGFAIPEVMGMGIPVVSVEGSSREEIIKSGENGFIVPSNQGQGKLRKLSEEISSDESKKIIKEISHQVEILVKDRDLLKKFSRNARREVRQGKFSIDRNNKKIERVYREALR